MNADDFVLCAATVAPATLWERVDLAADAGFAGVSVQARDCLASRAAGFPDARVAIGDVVSRSPG